MTVPTNEEIRSEMAKAYDVLGDAEYLLNGGRLNSATSRAYYAIFHAARALLWTKGLTPKSHKGLIQLFGQHLVKKGAVDEEMGKILKDAFDERELADYHAITGSFDNTDVTRLVTNARSFVEKMEEVIRSEETV